MNEASTLRALPRKPALGRDALVLGIETSCDETAAAVVARAPDGTGRIVANVVRSQWEQHAAFGGVVPEIAARAHAECLDDIVREAMRQAGVGFHGLDAVAVTAGPGLIGGLIVGIATARTIALVHGLPLAAVNHLEGHALTVGLTEGLRPPYLLLLVSGGHTQLVLVEAVGRYQRLGSTIDDALGEAFDKTAKLLGLPMPGGPAIERTAANGDPTRIALPRPMAGRPEPNFSFAGLKTAVRLEAEARVPLGEQDVADIAAAFESAAVASVVDRTRRAMQLTEDRLPGANALSLVVAGGVAANRRLRSGLGDLVQGGAGRPSHAGGDGATLLPTWRLAVPPGNLCTDNAAMIAWAGAERLAAGLDLGTLVARARWPLDEAAAPLIGAGRHGMKA